METMGETMKHQYKILCKIDNLSYNGIFNKLSECIAFLAKARKAYQVTDVIICEVS